jgi:6-pyruvoyltetrahydropterin/6-carboxytetrahydropterin synthase
MNKYRISKIFSDIPFAHRQPFHDGHCQFIHGHNWAFKISLSSDSLDINGFVHDFGKMKDIKNWLTDKFDHSLVVSSTDPYLETLLNLQTLGLAKLLILDSGSAEKIAEYVLNHLIDYFKNTEICVDEVQVFEDSKNSAKVTNEIFIR